MRWLTGSPGAPAASPFRTVFHPTDCSAESRPAFAHALRLAVDARAELVIMHVDGEGRTESFEEFPRVRTTLREWGALAPGGTKDDVAAIGLTVRKVRSTGEPSRVLLDYVARHRPDLIVLATSQRDGLARWQHHAVAEPVARSSWIPTIFVPAHAAGFVAPDTGAARLQRVLVPVAEAAGGERAASMAHRLARTLGIGRLDVRFLHVGPGPCPSVRYPDVAGWTWRQQSRDGARVPSILDVRAEMEADLVVMTTSGHDSLRDALWGSTTEQVVRSARCPVCAVPMVP